MGRGRRCIGRGDEMEFRAVMVSFVKWCLQLNITKTKELIIENIGLKTPLHSTGSVTAEAKRDLDPKADSRQRH